jgi:thermostable 8-oxoguanine DNA glycosylase
LRGDRYDQHGIAVLDTHVLAWLRSLGISAPKLSPTGKAYARLERAIVEICRVTGVSPAQLDLAIWRERQRRRHPETKTAA